MRKSVCMRGKCDVAEFAEWQRLVDSLVVPIDLHLLLVVALHNPLDLGVTVNHHLDLGLGDLHLD